MLAKASTLKCKSLCWGISETLRTQVQKSPCIKPQCLLKLLEQHHSGLVQTVRLQVPYQQGQPLFENNSWLAHEFFECIFIVSSLVVTCNGLLVVKVLWFVSSLSF